MKATISARPTAACASRSRGAAGSTMPTAKMTSAMRMGPSVAEISDCRNTCFDEISRRIRRTAAGDQRYAEILPQRGKVDGLGVVEVPLDQAAHDGGAGDAVAGGGILRDGGAPRAVETAPQHAGQTILKALGAIGGAPQADV